MKLAILGFGTVGSGAYEVAQSAPGLEVVRILDKRQTPGMESLTTQDIEEIVNDPEIDIVAECMGGTHPALEYVTAAMKHGKHVVTPNKNLVSAHFDELMDLAAENGVEFRFTPAAGGGIPWLFNLKRQARCDEIQEVNGIVNGTCNYILDNMHTHGSDFAEVLKEAQELGYAEKDPTSDIAGHDTQRKCVLSANLAFGARVKEEEVPTFGIDKITAGDIAYFQENGYTCKLMMNAGRSKGSLYAYVEPVLLKSNELAANVPTNNNLITMTGSNVGTLSFFGQGAGKMPTGTSVIEDALDISDGFNFRPQAAAAQAVDNSSASHRYYIRKDGQASISEPMSVTEAHALAAQYQDEPFFMAGIRE